MVFHCFGMLLLYFPGEKHFDTFCCQTIGFAQLVFPEATFRYTTILGDAIVKNYSFSVLKRLTLEPYNKTLH